MKKVLAVLLCVMMCLSSVSVFAQYTADEGETILTKYLKFQKVNGIVVCSGDNQLKIIITENYARENPYYQIGECVDFEVVHSNADELLGYKMAAYVKREDENDVFLTGKIKPYRDVDLTVSCDEIITLTPEVLWYRKKGGAAKCEIEKLIEIKKHDPISIECNVIVNGGPDPDFDVYKEYKKLDEITFVDSDNDGVYEFIVVNIEQ